MDEIIILMIIIDHFYGETEVAHRLIFRERVH